MRLVTGNAGQYRSLMLQGYEESPDAFTSTVHERESLPLAWWEDRLKPEAVPGTMVFGAYRDEILTGVAGLSISNRTRTSHKARLFGMYVHPDYRGLGIATELLDELLAYAVDNPALLEIQLTVTGGNAPAEQLYKQKGFAAWGKEPRAISSKGLFLDKIHMHRIVG